MMTRNDTHLEEANQQQHPIIFGKSKDSILVPDYLESSNDEATTKSPTSTTTMTTTTMMSTTTSGCYQRAMNKSSSAASNNKSGFCDSGADFVQSVTTHVLTDENGHSIKIRVASPPPQRQAQLAKLHLIARKQQQAINQQVTGSEKDIERAEPRKQRQRVSLVSQHSDSPLMWDEGERQRRPASSQSGADSSDDSKLPVKLDIEEQEGEQSEVVVAAADYGIARQHYTSKRKSGVNDRRSIAANNDDDALTGSGGSGGGEQAKQSSEVSEDETGRCEKLTDGHRQRLKPAMLTYVCQSCLCSVCRCRLIGHLLSCVV